jgi:hypothetical protein
MRWLADAVVLVHLGFILFAVSGGLLVLRWRRCAWLHIPAVIWAALVEFMGWVCPLTPLENRLRLAEGQSAYEAGFIEHYVLPVLYPPALTQELQLALGVGLLILNLGIYALVLRDSVKVSGLK